jgi:hypothetical protein
MSNHENEQVNSGRLGRIVGGRASRAELYGIAAVLIVLAVGGVSGAAVVLSSPGHQGAVAASTTQTSVDISSTTATTPPSTTTTAKANPSAVSGSGGSASTAAPQQGFQAAWSATMPDFVDCGTNFTCQVSTLQKIPAGWEGTTLGGIGEPGGMTFAQDQQCSEEGGSIDTTAQDPPPGATLTQTENITLTIICVLPTTTTTPATTTP